MASREEEQRETTPERGRGAARRPPTLDDVSSPSPSPPPPPPPRAPPKKRVRCRLESEEDEDGSQDALVPRTPSPRPSTSAAAAAAELANAPRKKKKRASVLRMASPPSPEVILDSEEEQEEAALVMVGFSNPPVRIKQGRGGKRKVQRLQEDDPLVRGLRVGGGEEEEEEEEENSGAESESAAEGAAATAMVKNPMSLPLVSAWEKGMEAARALMDKYHVENELKVNFKMLPDQVEALAAVCKTWLNEEHRGLQLTFSSNKTFVTMMGRFLQGYLQSFAEVTYKSFEPTGCALWQHRCTETEGELKCLHGSSMVNKEHVIEMDVTSENGQRALKEQASRAKIVKNRWGRNVVQIANTDARCCLHDASCPANQFSGKSCGMFFSEGAKAQMAFRQMQAFLRALYPNAESGHGHLLIPLRCDCNSKPGHAPFLGRQVPKITPFALSNAEDLDAELISDRSVLASVKYPALLVFQCCNPVYRNSRAQGAGPNCDFKISAPDLMNALVLTRSLWNENFPELPRLVVPEFKWGTRYQYRNVSLPVAHGDSRQNPFDF
nr:DBP [Human mastadenovirus C]